MTALITFAQDFQHFHLVGGDRFAPLTPNPAIARGIVHQLCDCPFQLDARHFGYLPTTVIMPQKAPFVKLMSGRGCRRSKKGPRRSPGVRRVQSDRTALPGRVRLKGLSARLQEAGPAIAY